MSADQPSEDRSAGPGDSSHDDVTDGCTIAEAMERLESDGWSGQFADAPPDDAEVLRLLEDIRARLSDGPWGSRT